MLPHNRAANRTERKQSMFSKKTARRNFMKIAGAGIAGTAIGASATASANTPPATIADQFNVKTFGATGDGKTLDTAAINKAIEAAADAGGAVVLFPAGTYLCYSIHLKSNITLYLGSGATILAADSPSAGGGYDPPEPIAWDKYQDYGHSHWLNSLIWGEGIENVFIIGPGLIWGKGLSRGAGDKPLAPGVGNKSISLKNCHNVTLRDFSMLHGGHFAILATGVDNLTIDNLIIDTNRDGMDIDCCRNVRLSNCSVNSPWDDAICLKSSYGLGFARATDHVTITNCNVTGGYEEGTLLDATFKPISPDKAPRNGRIKFGTESNGGFRNVTVSNCVIEDCRGIALETVDGGLLEDVSISNITMRGITDVPLFVRLGRRMRGPEGTPIGQLRRVNISNIISSHGSSRQACLITGIPGHSIEDLELSNIMILHEGRRYEGRRGYSATRTGDGLSRPQPLRLHAGPRLLHSPRERNQAARHRSQIRERRPSPRLRPRRCTRRVLPSREIRASCRCSNLLPEKRLRLQHLLEPPHSGLTFRKDRTGAALEDL